MALARPGFSPASPTISPAIGGGSVAASPWTDVNLGSATMTDLDSAGNPRSPGIFTSTGSSLSTVSTIVLNGTVHGRMDTVDGLFFTIQLTDFDAAKHFGVAIRASWGASMPGTWEMYLGVGNDSAPVSDGGVYLSTQLKSSSPSVGGNDYGQNPTNNQSVSSDARYLAGMINYRSDRQDGSCGQSANATRASRAGQNRSVDPGTALGSSQYLLVGFGNQSARADGTYNGTLTDLKVQFQLLAHYGLD
jgi:hypothetical protein